jgi:hypothetical protein
VVRLEIRITSITRLGTYLHCIAVSYLVRVWRSMVPIFCFDVQGRKKQEGASNYLW